MDIQEATFKAIPDRIFNPYKIVWTGGVSSSGFSAKIEANLRDIIVVSSSKNFAWSGNPNDYQEITIATVTKLTLIAPGSSIASVKFTGLLPSKTYFLGVKTDSSSFPTLYSKVTTFPIERQPSNFTFCSGASAKWTEDAGKTYNTIMGAQPSLFMLHLGNLFSGELGSTQVQTYYSLYKSALSNSLTADFLSNMPMYYIFDEYDYGTINGFSQSPTADAAISAFKAFYPYPSLPESNGRTFGYQAFSVGRVRFIITDLRSQSTGLLPNVTERSTMGSAQLNLFLSELDDFQQYKLIIWGSIKAWHEPQDDTSDQWAGYSDERTIIANRIAQLGINNLVMLVGHSDLLALDDGTHTDFAINSGAGMPLMHVAPIASWGTSNDAIFSGPAHVYRYYPNFQYAKLTVTDTIHSTCLQMDGCSLGNCFMSQKLCINGSNPSIVRQGSLKDNGGERRGDLVHMPWFPTFAWTTIISFIIITLFIVGFIIKKGLQSYFPKKCTSTTLVLEPSSPVVYASNLSQSLRGALKDGKATLTEGSRRSMKNVNWVIKFYRKRRNYSPNTPGGQPPEDKLDFGTHPSLTKKPLKTKSSICS